MDYALKTALIDVTTFGSAILAAYYLFHYLAKNVAAASFVGRSKKVAKNVAIFSILGILILGMLDLFSISAGFVLSKILLVSIIVLPFLTLSVLIAASLTHLSARLRFINFFKNKLFFGILALISATFSVVVYFFGHLVGLVASNIDCVDVDINIDGRAESMAEDQWRLDNVPGASGHYDLITDKYISGSNLD